MVNEMAKTIVEKLNLHKYDRVAVLKSASRGGLFSRADGLRFKA